MRRVLGRIVGLLRCRSGSIVCRLRWRRTALGRWSVIGRFGSSRDNDGSRSNWNRERDWDRSCSLGLVVGNKRSLGCSIVR